jgi:hypothetical protein
MLTHRRPGRVALSTNLAGLRAPGLIAAAMLCLAVPAQAGLVTSPLDFSASSQSIWGPGGVSLGFNFARSASVPLPFGLGTFSVGYSVGASSGQVWGDVDGRLNASYADFLSAPGETAIVLNFLGNPSGGGLHSTIGAHAQLTSSVGNVGPDFQLNVDRTFTPALDVPVTASNSLPNVVTLPLIDLLAAEAGVGLGVSQTNSFTPTSVSGTLFYSRQGSGVTSSIPFIVDVTSGLALPVELAEAGTWDFWFGDSLLNNSFWMSMALDLGVYASTIAGCGPFGVQSCEASYTLVSPTIYTGDTFALNFDASATSGRFSIDVLEEPTAVPEPSSLTLLGLGGLLMARRRRRKNTYD